jgi:pyruvate dehydrogenase E1 component beta subunit
MVVRTTIGGGKGYAGQHSQSLEAVCTHFPGLKVVAPSTAYDAKGLLKASIRDDNPVVFIEHQLLYTDRGVVPDDEFIVPLGQAAVRREGKDITIIGYSWVAQVAMQAAELLESRDGVSAEVIDIRSLCPLDIDTLAQSAEKTGRVIALSQAPRTGCFAEHIACELQERLFHKLKAPVRVVAAYNVPPPMAQSLERENMPNAEKVARVATQILSQ